MRRTLARAALAAALSLGALVAVVAPPAAAAPGGSGPYPADWSTSAGLPNHTVYRPVTLPAGRLPVVVWGNGACSADGTSAQNFLREIASWGFLVIANGNPGGSGSSTSAMLTQSIDWAFAQDRDAQSPLRGRIDTSEVGVAGFSCGGLEAYAVANDPRVTTVGIFSSGLLNDADDYQLRRLADPILYVIGGPGDIAYPNAMDDWGKLPAGLPAFMGNLGVGHGGTYHEANGGAFGYVAQQWFRWQLQGDQQAGRTFAGTDCPLCSRGWQVQRKNLVLGPEPTPTPTPTATPTPTPTPTPTATPTATPTPTAGPSACTAAYTVANQWGGGFVADVTVTAGTAVNGWRVRLTLPGGAALTHAWNGRSSGTGGAVTVANAEWNGTLRAGQSTSFGFQGTGTGAGATVSCEAA